LKFQGEKELWKNFGELDSGQNFFVNNLYPGNQSKKLLSNIER